MNIEYRRALPYMVICQWVTRDEIPERLPPLIAEVRDWLDARNITREGSPFFEYRVMSGNRMHVCVGYPVKQTAEADERVHAGAFPEGEYAVSTYTGDYKNLFAAHEALDEWFKNLGYTHRTLENSESVISGSRTEFYLTDPATEPDPKKWRTGIAVWVKKV